MSINPGTEKRWKTRSPRPVWLLLVGLVWGGATLLVFHPEEDQQKQNRNFAYHRIAEAAIFKAYALRDNPEVPSELFFLDEDFTRKELVGIYEYATAHKGVPETALTVWATLFAVLNENDLAEEIIAQVPTTSEEERNRKQVLQAILTGDQPSGEIKDWIYKTWNLGEAQMPEFYLLAMMYEEPNVIEWFHERGSRILWRSIAASSLGLIFIILALVSLLHLLRSPRHGPPSLLRPGISDSWTTGRLLFEFFVAFIVASLLAVTASIPFFSLQMYIPGMVVSGSIIMLFPPLWLTTRLTPARVSPFAFFKLHKVPYHTLELTCLGFIGFGAMALLGFSVSLLPAVRESILSDTINQWQLDTVPRIIWFQVLAVILAPLCEEIVFRGFLFGGLKRKMSGLVAALVSSSLFALLHGYSAVGILLVFVYGLVFCWLYARSGSLWPGILAHGLLNFLITSLNVSSYSFH